MAYKILLQLIDKISATSVQTKVEYECRNIQNFDYNISMPTNAMGIPEQFFDEELAGKFEENNLDINED